jgi:hypothetical protein
MTSKLLYCCECGVVTEHRIVGSNDLTALLCLQCLVRWAENKEQGQLPQKKGMSRAAAGMKGTPEKK